MDSVGIITFHCADDYGAMLQAYGLKEYLRMKDIKADIIRYEPPFMTGRYWWIPYIPIGSLKEILTQGFNRWRNNLKMGKSFFLRRRNMKQFRITYLISEKKGKLYFDFQVKWLRYQHYIVGSDQIWNPEITCGLRKVYFGAFKNTGKRKVISYAASMGKSSLSAEYDKQFSALLQHVDEISVREASAVPYIKQFYKGDVCAVLDPVFLLEEREWKKIENFSGEEGYIFVYMTEQNEELINYVKELSKKKKKLVIKVKGGQGLYGDHVMTDREAGPAEFLGYIHNADYVVTNSFHGTAFSIIFQKKFTVFQHSSAGERISNILRIHGLENRMYLEEGSTDIDDKISWDKVKKCTDRNMRLAESFLLKHVGRQAVRY